MRTSLTLYVSQNRNYFWYKELEEGKTSVVILFQTQRISRFFNIQFSKLICIENFQQKVDFKYVSGYSSVNRLPSLALKDYKHV